MALTRITSDGITDAAIVNADINASAAIAKTKIENLINNNADNRLITGSGTANTLEGEANFTYNSTLAQLTTDTSTNNTELIRLQNSHTDGKMTVMGFNTDGLGSSQTRIYGGNDNTGAASQQGDSGAGKFKVTITNPSGTHQEVIYAENDANTASKFVRLSTDGSERMRIDSSGNVGIGTTSPSAKLQVSGGHINIDSGYSYQWGDSHERIEQSDGKIEFFTNNGEQMTLSGGNLGIGTTSPDQSLHIYHATDNGLLHLESGDSQARIKLKDNAGETHLGAVGNDTVFWQTSSLNESMRIDSAGDVIVGGTTRDAQQAITLAPNRHFGAGRITTNRANTTNVSIVWEMLNNGIQVGRIEHDHTSAGIVSGSDYRLKENDIAISDGITRVKQLRPIRYNWKSEPSKTLDGFFAHEVSSIVPEAVSGEKDAVDSDGNIIMQGMVTERLVPLLTAALQEAIVRIEALEAS